MALTQDQWHDQIIKYVPSWVTQELDFAEALFQAIAAVFAQIDTDADDAFNSTFITRAAAPVLDMIGEDRNVARLPGEADADYAKRIQRITSQSDAIDILAAVNLLLAPTGAKMLEASRDNPFASRGTYASRDNYLCAFIENFFTLVVPLQTYAPGTASTYYQSIVALVNSMKAFGVMYRLVESTKTTVV